MTRCHAAPAGAYTDLPSSIEKLAGSQAQRQPERQQRRLRRITQLVYSHLLRVRAVAMH